VRPTPTTQEEKKGGNEAEKAPHRTNAKTGFASSNWKSIPYIKIERIYE